MKSFCESLPNAGSLQFGRVGQSAVSPLTLTCDTTGLPATLVLWTKGSSTLSNGPVYQLRQSHARNFEADFTNELVINQPINDAQGIYSCTVNSYSQRVQVNRSSRLQKYVGELV